jgi:GAF domain-containing protein
MTQPPRLATRLLGRLGAGSLDVESLQGDLVEQYRLGRSRGWYWRQVLAAIVVGAMQGIRAHRLIAVRGVVTGWVVLLLLFGALGDRVANGLAGAVWNWTRAEAYSTGAWWPFWLTAAFVSYGGFALSAWAVVRLHRANAAPVLVAYTASMVTVLTVSTVILEILMARGPVPVPHTLFYLVSVTLKHHWRVGFVMVPCVMLAAGLLGTRRFREPAF